MKIAICENDRSDLGFLKNQIEVYQTTNRISAEIDEFISDEDFLASMESYEIVFIDIGTNGINGIDTIKKRRVDDSCRVIFTSTSREYAIEAFSVCATHYLMKPLQKKDVFEAMDRCLRSIVKKSKKFLKIKTHKNIIPVSMADIIYIEVFNKISMIHTGKNDIQTYTSLDTLFEQLDDWFMRAQRSFIVNMNFIESISSDRVILKNGIEIVLSRTNRSKLKQQYQHFLLGLAREN